MRRILPLLFALFSMPCLALAQYKVVLTWQAPACMATNTCTDAVANYDVFRMNGTTGSFTQIAADVSPTTYTDTNIQYSATYEYYVTSVDAEGNQSPPSNTSTITIPAILINPVTGVTIKVSMNDGVVTMHFDNECSGQYDTVVGGLLGL